jgi:tyrosyl-tRNA synthetase
VTDALNTLLEPIRNEFTSSPEFQESLALAYPKPEKKVKKVKDKGSKHPGTNPKKTAEEEAKVLAEEGIAEDITTNDQGTRSKEQSEAQIQGAGKGVEDALNKLNVSDSPK